MEKTANGKRKGELLIVIILLVIVLGAGAVVVWLAYKAKNPDPVRMPDEMLLNISCEGLYRDLYGGIDTSFEGYEAFSDIFPAADATEEQRRERAESATIREAIRFYSEKANGYPEMKEINYSELMKNWAVTENGHFIVKEKLSESSGTKEKIVVQDITPSLDTKLSELFRYNQELVDRDASILETRQRILKESSKE